MTTELLSGYDRRKAAKRETIIAGAIQAFEQEGYERASMDLVAECAGASKRTVYNYFESKRELLWAVVAELMAEQQSMKQIPYSTEEPLETQLHRFVEVQMVFVMDQAHLATIRLLTTIFLQNQELREEASQTDTCPPDPLIDWLIAANEDKKLRIQDPELAAKMFRGMVEGIINFPALYSPPLTAEDLKPVRDEIVSLFLARYRA